MIILLCVNIQCEGGPHDIGMLPSLSKLGHAGCVTAVHENTNDGRLGLKDLPEDLRMRTLGMLLDGIGVPLMLVRYNQLDDQIAYMRLADPAKHELTENFFFNENYPFAEILAGVVEVAGYDENTSVTQFVDVRPYKEDLPEKLDFTDSANFGNDDGPEQPYNVVEMAREAVQFSPDGTPNGAFLQSGNRPQIVYNRFPSFKSHVAIVLNIDFTV